MTLGVGFPRKVNRGIEVVSGEQAFRCVLSMGVSGGRGSSYAGEGNGGVPGKEPQTGRRIVCLCRTRMSRPLSRELEADPGGPGYREASPSSWECVFLALCPLLGVMGRASGREGGLAGGRLSL